MYFNFENIKITNESTPKSKWNNKKEKYVNLPKSKQVKQIKTIKTCDTVLDLHEFLLFLLNTDRDLLQMVSTTRSDEKNILTVEITCDNF